MRASLRAHRERPWLRIEVAGEREGRVRKPQGQEGRGLRRATAAIVVSKGRKAPATTLVVSSWWLGPGVALCCVSAT